MHDNISNIPRLLRKTLLEGRKSVLILGPRQTGKSTLMRSLQPDLEVNLAHEATFLAFASNPRELEQRLSQRRPRLVFVDEVQRLPSLLNTLQAIIDTYEPTPRFLLTGSSARKLRRGQANLLPGRIHTFELGPLCAAECDYALDVERALATGTLPGIYLDDSVSERQRTLRSYAATYLKEEIQAEALTRDLEGFARFLSIAAATAGQYVDMTKLASEAQVTRHAVMRYFEILEDTLLVRRCESFAKSQRRRLIQHPRFFFFDGGVLNGLLGNFVCSADRLGALYEQLVFTQIVHSAAARDTSLRVSSFRTEHGAEVDFIVEFPAGECWAIEVKASRNVARTDLAGLRSFAQHYGKPHRPLVIYAGDEPRRIEDVPVLPLQSALQEMGL